MKIKLIELLLDRCLFFSCSCFENMKACSVGGVDFLDFRSLTAGFGLAKEF
jgi:hypothetical protein